MAKTLRITMPFLLATYSKTASISMFLLGTLVFDTEGKKTRKYRGVWLPRLQEPGRFDPQESRISDRPVVLYFSGR